MTNKEQDVLNRIEELIIKGELKNEFLVSNLKLMCVFLNLKTVKQYSNNIKKSTQGIRKYQKEKIIKICDKQFVIDNE